MKREREGRRVKERKVILVQTLGHVEKCSNVDPGFRHDYEVPFSSSWNERGGRN